MLIWVHLNHLALYWPKLNPFNNLNCILSNLLFKTEVTGFIDDTYAEESLQLL